MERVIVGYTTSVQEYFDNLIIALFKKDYFGYQENAINYVEKLVFYINDNIHKLPHKKVPIELLNYGNLYIFYKSNSRTTWFFFTKKDNSYLIKHVINNNNILVKEFNLK